MPSRGGLPVPRQGGINTCRYLCHYTTGSVRKKVTVVANSEQKYLNYEIKSIEVM